MTNPWEQDWGGSESQAKTSAPWEQDWDRPPDATSRGVLDKARDWTLTGLSEAGKGSMQAIAGVADTAAAPAAKTRSMVTGGAALADRLYSRWTDQPVNQVLQELAQDDAAKAEQQALENANNNAFSRGAMALRDASRERVTALGAFDQEFNPELIRQQQETAKAEGFVGNMAAIKDNPMAFFGNLAKSAAPMAMGGALSSTAARSLGAAGRIAGMSDDAVAAIARSGAGAAGVTSEAAFSGAGAREGIRAGILETPHAKLAEGSPRYQALMRQPGMTPALARETLANEVGTSASLFTSAATALGSVVTNKLFGNLEAKMLAGQAVTAKEAVQMPLKETLEETAQGLGEDAIGHAAMLQADKNHQFDVGGSIAQNAAAGFGMSAPGAAGGYANQRINIARGLNPDGTQPRVKNPPPAAAPAGQPPPAAPAGDQAPAPAAGQPAAAGAVPGAGTAATLAAARLAPGQFDYATYDAYRTTLESGGRADAKAATSSATGLHQFTNKTWLNTVKSAKPAWANGLSDAQLLTLRTDPAKSTEMVRVLDNENAARLQGAKQPVTVHNLYAAHHFGSGRAIDFAKAGDNVLMNNILTPAQIKANSYLGGKTKAEAIAIWDRRAAKAGVKVDGSAAMGATPTQQEQAAPDPIADQPVHSQAEAEAEAAPATQEVATDPERVAEIDEETAALERRQKKLQDAEYGAIFDAEREAIAQELADLRRERDDLFAQKLMPEPAAEVAQPAPMAAPNPTAPIRSEAAALQARQQQTGTEPVLQNRDRATKASIDQMNAIAANPDYMMAGVSRSMDTGAPVVVGTLPASATLGRTETVVDGKRDRTQTQYAVVEAGDVLTSHAADGTPNADYATGQQGKVRAVAGNARSAGLIAGYERGTTSNYRSELEADAEAHGIPAEVIRGMTNPVLVRVMNAADLKQDAGDRSNIGAGARLSPAEEAANDARRVDLAAIEFDDDGMPRANSVLGFVQAMPVTERNAMLMKDGRPSKQAVDRLMAATFRAAYGSDALTELYAAAQDQEARTVMAGIARSAGAMAKLEGAGEYDIRGLVTEAAQMAVNAVRSGQKLSDWARNLDLDMSPAAAEVARFFADNIRSANRIAEGLREWAGLALEQALAVEQNEAGAGMFGDIPTLTREQLIERLNNATDQQTDLADTGGPVAAAQDTEGRTPGRRREGSGQEDGRVDRSEVPQEAAQGAAQEGDQVDGAARSEAAVTAPPARADVQRSEGATAAANEADGNDEIAGLARSIEQAYAELKRLQADRRKARGDSRQAITERIERLKQGIADYEALLLDMRRQAAVADFKGAMADLADIATKHQRAAVVPESAPDLMPTLVRLFDAAIRIVGTDMRAATSWVQAQLRANPDTKKLVNRIEPMTYRKAAEQAVAAAGDAQGGLFTSIGEADQAVQASPKRGARRITSSNDLPSLDSFVPSKVADLRNRASLEGSPVEDGRMAINLKSPESSNRNQRPSGKPTYASPPNDSSKTQPGGNLSGTFMGSPDAPIVLGGKGPGVDGAVSDKTASAADDALRQRFTLSIPMFGDVPYRASAPVDAGGAEVLSSRVMVTSTKLTKHDAEVLGLSPDKKKVYAWRVSVVRGPYGVYSIIEAMDADYGRSSDGEVLARFKEVSNVEHVERLAPAVARAARADFAAQAQELESYTSDDLRQRDNERQQADAAEQRQRQDDARRAQADAERGEFTLTGSDRAVDVAEAHGQQTMFSRARTPAQPRNLVTLHNLTVDNLLHADNIGGLPVPSLGITKVDSPFNGFGDITLIGPRGMIDPESGVPVFDRDAYTGRYPEMNYKRPKTKAAEALYNRMTAARELGGDGKSFVSQLWDSIRNDRAPNPRKLADLFERHRAPRLLYAREMLGKEIKAPMREQYRRYPFSTDKQLLAYIRKDRQARREGAERTQEQHDQARAELSRQVMAAIQRFEDGNAAIKESGIADDFREEMFDENGLLLARAEGSIERDAETVGVKVVDEGKLEAAIRKVVPRDDAGYQAWVKALVDPLFEPPTITLRGREVEPTLDNIVAAMTIGQAAGAEKTMNSGTGKTAALLGKRFKSIADIQAARDQVVSDVIENEAKKTNEQVLNEYQNAVLPFFKYKNWKGEVDTWAGLDAAMEALAGAGKRGSTDAAIRQALSKQGFTGVDQATVNLARQSIDALRNTPTNYFEAKPQRAVGLDEFRGAVVPRGTDPRALAVLAKHGIEVVEYGKGEGARDKAIATLSKKLDKAGGDVLFSRAGEGAAAQQRSMPVAVLQTMADRVARALPNLPTVNVLQSTQDTRGELRAYLERQGAMGDAEGAFHNGELYLFADNLASMERAEHVLATHEAGHAGLAGMLGADKARVLQSLLNRNDNLFRQAQAEAKRLKVPLLTAVEEVLVDMKPADLVKLDGWRKVVFRVQRWLDKSGFKTLAKQVRQWMEGRLTDQQQADMLAADLMFAAHDYLAGRDQRLWRRANPPLLSRATTPQPGAQGQQAQPATTVAGRAKARLQSLISPERVDAFIYGVQDKLIDLKRLRAHIQELGGTVNDLNDAYQGEELYHGRVARRSAAFLENEVAPLMKELRSEGYTIQQLEQYLHARHAPEANRVLAERNPNAQMIDAKLQEARTQVRDLERQLQRARAQGTSVVALEKALELAKEQEAVWKSAEPFRGTEEERLSLSGMSDADAAAHMAGLSRRDARRLALIAEKVDAIQKGTTDALVDYGLHDQETIDAWRDTYQYYVPLHRDEAHESAASHPIGQGFSVRGDASKRRVGSNQKVTNIFSHIVMQREAAITRGEKNHVAKQLYLMARQNPAPEWWSTDKAPRKRTVDKATGLVHTTVDPQYRTRENAVVARIAGREVAVVFNERNERAMRLARALKNLDGSDLPFLLNMSAKVTRYFSAINTQYNPVFGVVNFVRDTQAALLNMESAGIAGGRVAMMRTLGSTYRAIWREARGKTPTNQSWSQLWGQLREDGGTTGYRELFAMPEDRAKALQRELTRDDASAPVKAGRAVLKLLENYNDAMENATRLAVYKVALDRGMSRQQAASVAKNLTVNFNRKGANSRHLGSLYAFFNAAVQGMARMVQTLSGPNGKKVMLGGVALGAMNTMLGYMMMGGGDDQDDEWSRIPEFVKVNSIVLPTSRTTYLAIPMPLGFNMFPNLGRIATEWAMGIGNKGGGERSLEMLGAIIDAFNPLGGGGNIPQVLAPTVLDPALALIQNRDWKNQPVFQEDFNSMDPTPGHQRVKESASAFSRAAAKGINSATGGTDFMPGAWSPTPDQLDFVIGQITGGVGRESLKLMQAVGAQFTGDELPAHKVPLVGRFSGSTTGPSGGAGQFYDNIRRLNTLENELIGRNRAGEDTTSLYRENPETALILEGKMAYNQVSRLRKDRIREREEKRDGYQDVIKSIDADIDLYMRELNRNMSSRAIREAVR